MQATRFPFGVRLMGFSPADAAALCAALARAPASGPAYSCLLDASLQEPDLYIANGDSLKAIAELVALSPGTVQPALVVGAAPADLPYAQLARPFDAERLWRQRELLVAQRAEAVARLSARGIGPIPERRRQVRLDLDVTDPSEYARRRRGPPDGAVLIVDQRGALRDHLAKLLGARKRAIEWTDSAPTALRLCEETPVALVIVNTSMPGIDPYGLCAGIKEGPEGARIAVVLLVGPACPYDPVRGKAAGVRGLLDKPVADRHLLGAVKRLLSLPS